MAQTSSFSKLYAYNVSIFYSMLTALKCAEKDEHEKILSLIRENKRAEETYGQYGYWASSSTHLNDVSMFMRRYNLKSITDLGCGPGHFIAGLLSQGFDAKGIDIEDVFVKVAYDSGLNVKKGNILNPLSDINTDAVFMYEPFADPKLQKQFITNLENTLPLNTYVFYHCASGYTRGLLIDSDSFKRMGLSRNRRVHISVDVFKKIKHGK